MNVSPEQYSERLFKLTIAAKDVMFTTTLCLQALKAFKIIELAAIIDAKFMSIYVEAYCKPKSKLFREGSPSVPALWINKRVLVEVHIVRYTARNDRNCSVFSDAQSKLSYVITFTEELTFNKSVFNVSRDCLELDLPISISVDAGFKLYFPDTNAKHIALPRPLPAPVTITHNSSSKKAIFIIVLC